MPEARVTIWKPCQIWTRFGATPARFWLKGHHLAPPLRVPDLDGFGGPSQQPKRALEGSPSSTPVRVPDFDKFRGCCLAPCFSLWPRSLPTFAMRCLGALARRLHEKVVDHLLKQGLQDLDDFRFLFHSETRTDVWIGRISEFGECPFARGPPQDALARGKAPSGYPRKRSKQGLSAGP